ncbi:MAG: Ig-like domain-containing protein, partial [Burkholderiales bacterium]
MSITGLPTASMLPGQSAQLTATLTYSDSSSRDVSTTANWSTTNTSVLSVSAAGTIVAVSPGQADVVASAQGLSIRQVVRVEQPPAPQLTLFAGSLGGPGTADGLGVDARFNSPTAVAADSAGNLYVGDRNNYTIRRIDAAGVVTTFAGSPGMSGSADGAGSDARFMQLWGGLAADSAGNVYVADNYTIRRVTPDGIVSTWVGMPGVGGGADGSGAEARFGWAPRGLAIDRAGNVYVADTANRTIRRITPAGVVSTLAGLSGVSGGADGVGSEARFASPRGIAADRLGNLYVADGHRVRKITPAGVVSTLAGAEGQAGSADGPGTASRFNDPSGVATDSGGNIYVADSGNYTIRRITPDGVVSTVAGTAGSRGSADGVGP